MKLLVAAGGVLVLAGIAVLAYVLIAPRKEAPAPPVAAAAPSATNAEPKPPARREPPARPPLVRPPASATALEIDPDNEELINELGNYPAVEVLRINCLENLAALPDSIGTLSKLRELNMDEGNGCVMNPLLPESIGSLSSLEKLVLYGAQDPRLATEREARPRERHKFPSTMSRLQNLTYLSLGRNGMPEIPRFVADLPRLKVLDFSWNMEIKEIPVFLTNLQELTSLHLESDGLTDLPDFLDQLPQLREVRLGNNCSITQNPAKRQDLQRRFPKITFNFQDEYECPEREAPASPAK